MPTGLSRRNAMKLFGAALIAPIQSIQRMKPGATVGQRLIDGSAGRGTKPVFLAPLDSIDPAVHSLSENLFWNDILMEHAGFFALLMPGPDLTSQRQEAERFRDRFSQQFDQARAATLDSRSYPAFNRATVEIIKPFIEYKQRMLDAQQSGKMNSLVWPLFFDHTIREAEWALRRLTQIADGNIRLDFPEVVDFWSGIMSEHTEFIAHLLDPSEQNLIGEALDSSAQFRGFQLRMSRRTITPGEILLATEDLIDFKTGLALGIETGGIRSIIQPALADHVRREGLKFADELKRSGNKT